MCGYYKSTNRNPEPRVKNQYPNMLQSTARRNGKLKASSIAKEVTPTPNNLTAGRDSEPRIKLEK